MAVDLSWVRCTSGATNGLNDSGWQAIKGSFLASFIPADSSHAPTLGKTASLYSISRCALCFFSSAFNFGIALRVSASLVEPSTSVTQLVTGASLSWDMATRKGPIVSTSESTARASSTSRCQAAKRSTSPVTVPVVWAMTMSVGSAENEFAVKLFRRLPRRYDLLAEVLSFGQNRRWRAELVKHVIAGSPARVLDVATGTAGVAMAIARQSNAHITGVDVSEDMLESGRRRVLEAGLDGRIELDLARAEELPFADGGFDAISFTYVLRYVSDPAATIAELSRTLRPGGVMAGLD